MTTAKEARESLEHRIKHGGFADWSPDRDSSFAALARDLDAYAAAVDRETEARVRAEIAASLMQLSDESVHDFESAGLRRAARLLREGKL